MDAKFLDYYLVGDDADRALTRRLVCQTLPATHTLLWVAEETCGDEVLIVVGPTTWAPARVDILRAAGRAHDGDHVDAERVIGVIGPMLWDGADVVREVAEASDGDLLAYLAQSWPDDRLGSARELIARVRWVIGDFVPAVTWDIQDYMDAYAQTGHSAHDNLLPRITTPVRTIRGFN